MLIKKHSSLRTFLDAWIEWDLFRIKFLNFMQAYDVILCPVAANTALLHTESFADPQNFKNEQYLTPYTLMGWPCVVVKAGNTLSGLPIGIQIVAKHRQDYLALHAALAVELHS